MAATVPVVLGAAGVAALLWWAMAGVPVRGVVVGARMAGADRAGQTAASLPAVDLVGTFAKGDGVAGKLAGSWAGFRGDGRTGISDQTGLVKDWAGGQLPRVWEVAVGEGYAGAAVRQGRVYLLDYDAAQRADVLRCWSLDDGREIWRRAYEVDVKRNHGMSRTVPALGEKVVVTLGPKCHVLCVDRETGEYRWGKDLVREYGTKVPPWYAGQCPLVEKPAASSQKPEERVVLAPGGTSVLMVCLEAETGKETWRTPNVRKWGMTHSSIMPLEVGGRRMYVYCGSGGVCGIDAATGQELWANEAWKVTMATVPSPVDLGEGRILLTGGYGAGAMIVEVKATEDKFDVAIVKRLPPADFGAEQQTPIFYNGFVYGVIPGGELVCMDRDGNRMWSSGGGSKFGLGPYVVADGAIYAVNDRGQMMVVEASEKGFKALGKGVLVERGHECWGPLAVVSQRMIGRDLTRMVCVDVGRH